MLVKGIKHGRTIELLEDIDLPDNEEILVEIKKEPKTGDFWSALQDFRKRMEEEEVVFEDSDFENLRDKSVGRDVIL
jgi:hypothetical protein